MLSKVMVIRNNCEPDRTVYTHLLESPCLDKTLYQLWINPLKPGLHLNNFQHSFPTSQQKRCISIKKPSCPPYTGKWHFIQRKIRWIWKDLVGKMQSCGLLFWIIMPVTGQSVSNFWDNRTFRDKCFVPQRWDSITEWRGVKSPKTEISATAAKT
jgi:hypothetical protein